MFRRSLTLAATALLAGTTFAGAQQMTDEPGISSDSPPFSISEDNQRRGNFGQRRGHFGRPMGGNFGDSQQMTDEPGISSDSPPFSISQDNQWKGNFAAHTLFVGDYNVNDDWECITTVNGVTYIGSDTGRLGAKRELRHAGFQGPYACSHDGGES